MDLDAVAKILREQDQNIQEIKLGWDMSDKDNRRIVQLMQNSWMELARIYINAVVEELLSGQFVGEDPRPSSESPPTGPPSPESKPTPRS